MPKRFEVVPIAPVLAVGGSIVEVNSVVPSCTFVPAVIEPVVG